VTTVLSTENHAFMLERTPAAGIAAPGPRRGVFAAVDLDQFA
jgi:hypothetical protein